MKSFQKPLWWFFILVLPLSVLWLSEFSVYSILDTELKEPESFQAWYTVLGLQGFIVVASGVYLGFTFKKNKTVHWIFPALILLIEIVFLFLLTSMDRDLIPWSVPNWMVNEDEFMLTHIALSMPSVFFAILQLVSYSIQEDKEYKIWKSALVVILIPASWYCFYMIVIPLFRSSENYEMIRKIEHIVLVIGIIMTVVFFYFLIRTLILLSIKSMKVKWLRIFVIVLTTLVLPVLGLWVNDYNIFSLPVDTHVFGDFSHWAFYALTISNAALLLIPKLKNPSAQKLTVALRFVLLPFTLYFLLVFIPFLPLSVLAILVFGAGFLVLSPVLTFVFTIHRIITDMNDEENFPDWISKTLITLPVLVLPAVITVNFWLDKQDLKNAMAYVYEPDYSQKEISVDKDRLRQVLSVIAVNGSNRSNLFRGSEHWKPYLSTYYRWLVLDNLTLSGKKMSELEQIFLGTSWYYSSDFRQFPDSGSTIISRINSVSKNEAGFVSTWVHLEIENQSAGQQEYHGNIKLPEGAYIRNYYLDVNGVRNYGILAERKTAQWVYNNIVSFRRDPGLLTYAARGVYDLKVFPLDSHQLRKTGFEIIYPSRLIVAIQGSTDLMASPEMNSNATTATNEHIVFLTEQDKHNLPAVTRKPFVYFILNNSLEFKKADRMKLADRLETEIPKAGLTRDSYEILLVNHSIKTSDKNKWKDEWRSDSGDGGYFANRAIRSILVEHYRTASRHVPVFVLVSNSAGIGPKVEHDLSFTCPDYQYSYLMTAEGIHQYSLLDEPGQLHPDSRTLGELLKKNPPAQVRCWSDDKMPRYFLPEKGSSVVFKNENFVTDLESKNSWEQAVVQAGNTRYLALNPNETERKWRALLKQNFTTGILSPYTAYMVVETEAQKEVLLKKQKEVMNAAPAMDLEQGFVSMSEPEWWWYGIGLLVFLAWRKSRQRQPVS